MIVLDVALGAYGGRAMLLALAIAALGPAVHARLARHRTRRGHR
jgi:hypothetical protein